MSLYTSLYYPSASVSNPRLLHHGLLLWDQIEYITPFQGYKEYSPDDTPELVKAKDLLLKPYLPNQSNKALAHQIILELANSDLPEWFLYGINEQDTYSIYPDKLLPETWNQLWDSKLIKNAKGDSYNYIMSSSFGLTIMSILADICAGKQKRTVTDKIAAYAGLTRYITKANDGLYGKEEVLNDYERLVTISLELIDVQKIPMDKLIKFREKESGAQGYHYTTLRHNYLDKIDSYIKRLCTEALHIGDQEELLRQFKNEMQSDLSSFADALETKQVELVYSKETLVAVAAAAGTVIDPITAGIVGVGSLVRLGFNYTDAKKKLQREHAMSWLCNLA